MSFDSHVIAMSYKEENIYWYGYTWGGIFTTCASYKANFMAPNDAKYMIESMVEVAKKNGCKNSILIESHKKFSQGFFLFGI